MKFKEFYISEKKITKSKSPWNLFPKGKFNQKKAFNHSTWDKDSHIIMDDVDNSLPEFIMLIGIPGSGKSTWINKYNRTNKYLVISPDLIRKEITGNISDQTQNAKVWQITKERVVNALKNGENVILDSTMTNSMRRKEFIKGLPPSQLKAKIFIVDPKVVKERIKKDIESGKDRAAVPEYIVDRMQDELLDGINDIEAEGFQIIE